MRLTAGTIGAAATAAVIVVATAGAASAVKDRSGYIECNSNRDTSVSSTTSKSGLPAGSFYVGHIIGNYTYTWQTSGYHSRVFPPDGGQWFVATNGSISSAGAGCV